MKAKYTLIAAAAIAAFVLTSWLRLRNPGLQPVETPQNISVTELSEGEQKIQRLIREVYPDAILSERFVREAGDVQDQLSFDTNKAKIQSLSVNLSSLARKQKDEGLSDGAVKAGLKY
jgi:hypothetical protein